MRTAALVALAVATTANADVTIKTASSEVDLGAVEAYLAGRLKEAAGRLASRSPAKSLVSAGLEPGRDSVARADRLGAMPPSIGTADPIAAGVTRKLGLTRDPALAWAVRDDLAGSLRRPPTAAQLATGVKAIDTRIAALNARLRERRAEVQKTYAEKGKLPEALRADLARTFAAEGTAPSQYDGGESRPGQGDPDVEKAFFLQMLTRAARGE
jgi:hypothetical protein